MNRNSGNVSHAKKLFPGAGNNSKPNRKLFKHLSESSTVSSDRNSSAQSEEEGRIPDIHVKPPVIREPSFEEQEHLVKKLKTQVKELRHKLRVLEESVESKDYSLGTIAKEKDRAMGEIRRLERSNKQLRQQLNDERTHYLEEKEKFCTEMTKFKKKLQETKAQGEIKKTPIVTRQPLINQSLRWQLNNEKGDYTDVKPSSSGAKMSKSQTLLEKTPVGSFIQSDSHIPKTGSLKSFHLYEGDDVSLQMAALRTENAKLRSIICERDERNYELCLRFLRMKHCKNDIKSRFQDLESEYLQVIANLMDKIDEARQEFNFIIDQKFKRPLHSTNAMYLQLVQKNSRIAFENASLRLENQCLKKELNRHANGVSDSDRKPSQTAPDNGDVKLPFSDGKLKKAKKNVNFKEIRTIYDRGYAFKNSDTDSNYMSKTSTTVPSNGSLRDVKSTDSVVDQEKPSTSFQASFLPDDILKKIFKRIDTSSCQTSDSARSKGNTSSGVTIKDSDSQKEKSSTDHSEKKQDASEIQNDQHKYPSKLTDSSSVCESKESIELRESVDVRSCSPTESMLRTDDAEREDCSQDSRLVPFRNHIKARTGEECDVGERAQGKKLRNKRHEKLHHSNKDRKSNATLKQEFKDCCGLQEKFDICHKELPLLQIDDEAAAEKGQREKAEEVMARIDLRMSADEDESVVTARKMRYVSPAVGSRSKSSNKVNLQDELLDAVRNQRECGDPAIDGRWKKEVKSRTSTSSTAIKEIVIEAGLDVTQSRRTEGSKRFSHRLISTSPETLRNILTESQLGSSYRMGPFIVGHATTEINSAFKTTGAGSNEIFLQLLIPKSTTEQSSQVYVNKEETTEKTTIEKETSMSGLISVKSTTRVETCTSGIRIPTSIPTSNSTLEIVDSTPINYRSDKMLRTLSAPGLLESDWLDQYFCCEMKDSSTNT